jgi:hypothetical protein
MKNKGVRGTKRHEVALPASLVRRTGGVKRVEGRVASQFDAVVKGHDFSRAEKRQKDKGVLTPEGRQSGYGGH